MAPIAPSVGTISKLEVPEPATDGANEAAMVRPREQSEKPVAEVPPRARSGRGRQKEGVLVFESTEQETPTTSRQSEVGYGSLQPTSYWSVPEQRDFPQLLAHFGRDFEGISNFMKTKTTVMVKNYFQRRIDSGQKDFEDIVADAEHKKARGERTGPLPAAPNIASRRRYEATPSSIIMPRPLAPHTEGAAPEPDEARVVSKSKHTAPSPQTVPLHARPPPEKERNVSRYPPLAQASTPMAPGPVFSEDFSRARAHQASLPPRAPGPRLGYFQEERREMQTTVLPHTTTRPQETPISARQTPVPAPDMARMEPIHSQGYRTSGVDVHGSPLLPTQGTLPSTQQSYMQHQPQPSLMPTGSHSRQPSGTKPPSSPAQPLQKQEQDMSPIRHDHISQRSYYPLPGQHVGLSQPPPVLSPPKEALQPAPTAAEPEAPRQVPAKRSNILSILNDEPEEPQPRKRFASDQASNPGGTAASPSRPVYTGSHSYSQAAAAPRQEETHSAMPTQKTPVYVQQTQYLPPSRGYVDYQSYTPVPGSSGAPANNDWMARFDPRGQQQQQQPPPPHQQSSRSGGTLAPQPPYSPYASNQSLSGPGASLPNLSAPSPVPTPSPAPSQRAYHTNVYAPSPVTHAQAAAVGSRDLGAQNQVFRPTIGSPTPRANAIAYGSRQGPPTPIQSPANLLGMSRPAASAAYATPTSVTPAPTHVSAQQHHSGHQTYQQHVQTMVSGAHQQPPHRSALGLAGAHYGHNTPPPQAQGSRAAGLSGPQHQAMSMGRSYTPPAILQPNPAGGLSYAPGGPQAVGVHPLQARGHVSGTLSEVVPGSHGAPGHHRVYSQGSNAGPLPGPLTPQHPSR
ncbi:hypothetical protein BDV32DRAFT_117323 [Aspergillus pseudonomiae]|nr:hypothetical protein BDV32DRAFT_117323 [Aspergillus pseudonomiae]